MTFARFAAPAIAGLILAAPTVALAQAQDYPTRPVTLVAPWPAGGAIDTLCRILGPTAWASPSSSKTGRERPRHRNRPDRESRPRWIHAGDGRRYGTRSRGHGLQKASLRSDQGFCAYCAR